MPDTNSNVMKSPFSHMVIRNLNMQLYATLVTLIPFLISVAFLSETTAPLITSLVGLIIYFCLILAFFSLVRRYKAETLWSNSVLRDLTKMLSEHTFKYRLSISYLLYLGCNTLIVIFVCYYVLAHRGGSMDSMPFLAAFGLWLVGNIAAFYFLYRNAFQTDSIHEAI